MSFIKLNYPPLNFKILAKAQRHKVIKQSHSNFATLRLCVMKIKGIKIYINISELFYNSSLLNL